MPAETANWVGLSLSSGRFEITARLGAGGMGFVYLARDHQQKIDVVIKVPRQQMLDDPEFAGRFRREIKSLQRLTHDRIAKIIDVGDHEGRPFVVLDFLPGGSLRDRIEGTLDGQAGGRSLGELQSWLPGIAAALDFCHANQCIHRDVKPDNILFDAAGQPYLSDFGIAKVLGGNRTQMTVMTVAGMVLGTPQYMAPEIIMGQEYDGRSDQYALALTAYEALSGRHPIDGPTPAAVMVQQTAHVPPPLDKVAPSIPRALSAAVARAMAKAPEERFPTCAAFAGAVVASLAGQEAESSPGGTLVGTPVITCPVCKKLYRLRVEMFGKQVRCKRCETSFQVPGKKSRDRNRPSKVETKPTPQSSVETPRAQPADIRGRRRPRRRLLWSLLAGVVLLAALGGGGVYLAHRLQPGDPEAGPVEAHLAERVTVAPGGRGEVDVVVQRGGFKGPVAISPVEWPAQLKAEKLTLSPEQATGKLVLQADGRTAEGEFDLTVNVVAGDTTTTKQFKLVVQWPVGEIGCLRGHNAPVTCVALSPHGAWALSGCAGGEVRYWDCWAGKQDSLTAVGSDEVSAVAFAGSQDPAAGPAFAGNRILAGYRIEFGSPRASVRVWNFEPEQVREAPALPGANNPVLAVAWNAKAKRIVAAGLRRGLALAAVANWDAATGNNLPGTTFDFTLAAAGPEARFLLLLDTRKPQKHEATLWNVADFTEAGTFSLPLTNCTAAALAADGNRAVFVDDAGVSLWDLGGGKATELGKLPAAAAKAVSLAFSVDGHRLLTGHTDGALRLWDVESRKELRVFQGHKGEVKSVSFSGDGRFAASGADKTVRWWKLLG